MRTFAYKIVDQSNTQYQGTIDAVDIEEAKLRVNREYAGKCYIISIKPKKTWKDIWIKLNAKPIEQRDVLYFTRQLVSLLESGVVIIDAIKVMRLMSINMSMVPIMDSIIRHIETGGSFSEACAPFPKLYRKEHVVLIRTGEVSGNLDKVLMHLYLLMDWESKLKDRIKKALRYPMMVISFSFITFLGVFIFIIPRFIKILSRNNTELSLLTRGMVALSQFLVSFGPFILGALVLLAMLMRLMYKTGVIKREVDHAIVQLPVFGRFYRMILVARITRQMGMMYSNGIPLVQTIKIVKDLYDNQLYREDIERTIGVIEDGGTFAEATRNSPFFHGLASQMIATGERSANLGEMLEKSSELYIEQVDFSLDYTFTYLEPLILIIMAVVILLLVMGIFLPIISMTTSMLNI